ncbi:MAG: ATP-dependent helicase [Gammaproteobacteria bacterium AqS3]|nr:ATP-dependent helicase [Gammaproteobacteria bacterium AqS3]
MTRTNNGLKNNRKDLTSPKRNALSDSDREIRNCIDKDESFAVVAGAGSGKTRSLINALDYIRQHKRALLRKKGRRVVCITYTNRAVNVILKRLNFDDLFIVSTLHSFLWGEIKSFQQEIKTMIKDCIIPSQIAKNKLRANGRSTAATNAQERIAKYEQVLENINEIEKFKYDDSPSKNYEEGQLDHDDVIELSGLMIKKFPAFQKIIGQKYPYIFVDEAQDTDSSIICALNLLTSKEGPPIVGYFGDPMQQIYDERSDNFSEGAHLKVITKRENYRCSKAVIQLLNSFRQDVQQVPAGENCQGSVQVMLVQSEKGKGYRKTYSSDQMDRALTKFDAALDKLNWQDDTKIKSLFLTHKMIARRLGFLELHELFNGPYASLSTKNDYQKGEHFLLRPFFDPLIPLVRAFDKDDQQEVFKILQESSPLLSPSSDETLGFVRKKARKAVRTLVKEWKKSSLREILELSLKLKIIPASTRLADQIQRTVRSEEYDENEHEKDKGEWLADRFFEMKTDQLEKYYDFIYENTPFSTQHGVKGEEYDKVLVFYDDTETNWNNYNFAKLLSPETSGESSSEKQKDRTKKLAYVSFSRAKKDLVIILFTLNPCKVREELIEKGYFSEDQIEILDA